MPGDYRLKLSAMTALAGLGCATALIAVGAHAQQGFFTGGATTFTAGQAAQGKTAFAANCSSCHGADLDDGEFGPPLKGDSFKSHWAGQSQDALFSYIQTRMPPSGPGTLSVAAYNDLVAYILQGNGAAASGGAGASAAAPAAARSPTPQHAPQQREHDAVYNAVVARRAAKLAALTPVTDAMLRHPSDADWLVWRRTYQNQGFSPLKQITKANVHALRTAWSWSLPISENEIGPLVHDGVMFLESAGVVQALDAETGERLWQYIRPLPEDLDNGRATRMKSIAIYKDSVIVGTPDGHVVALDVRTGKPLWDQQIFTSAQGSRNGQAEGVALHLDGGPMVAKGKVIVGVSLGITNAKGGCFIVALDAATGKEAWRFDTVAQPGQPGGDTWNGHPGDQRYGGGVWTAGSYDPTLNLVYFGVGNTYDSQTLLSPRQETGPWNYGLYTDSTLALDVDTGKLAWHFQHVHRDVWDLDWVFEQTLVDLPVDGKPRSLVVTGGKIALFDAMDRATGKYVFSKDLGVQNLVQSVDPKTGEKTINPALEPEAGKAKLLCPGSSGARSWPTTSYNPVTHILYVPMIEDCADWTYQPRDATAAAAGGIDMRFVPRHMPGSDGNFGRLEAVNLETRKVVWTRRQRAPVASSMLATAGGVVFDGSVDRTFSAYDEMTGKVLWQARLNASPSSSPITYSVKGQQYVAVVTGGGGAFDAQGRGLNPEVDNPAGGTTVVVFKLPAAGDVPAS